MKKLIASSLSIALISSFAMDSAQAASKNKVTNVAHRGASGYAPENTIAAYDKAVQMGADYFEIDVQVSKDGKLVLIHDNTVNRTTNGKGFVGTKTLAELKQLDAGSWFNPSFQNEKIPTFEEVLDRYKGNKIGILIELKSPELYPGVEEKVAKALKDRNLDKPSNNKIIIQSFNHLSVQKSKRLLPNIPHGVLLYSKTPMSDDLSLKRFSQYADYYNPSKSSITKELVDKVHRYGMKVEPYTVRKSEEVDPLLQAGVDGIITDYPDFMYGKTKRK